MIVLLSGPSSRLIGTLVLISWPGLSGLITVSSRVVLSVMVGMMGRIWRKKAGRICSRLTG